MPAFQFWTIVLCASGAIQCLFLAGCLILPFKNSSTVQKLLAFLLLLLGIRVLKSTFYILPGQDISLMFMNVGFAAHYAAACILYAYVYSILVKEVSLKWILVQLVPAFTIVAFAPWLRLADFWYMGPYSMLLFATLFYWLTSCNLWIRHVKQGLLKNKQLQWIGSLLIGTGVFFISYFANYVLQLIPYSTAPLLYSLIAFPLGVLAWHNHNAPEVNHERDSTQKYINVKISKSELEKRKAEILQVLTEQKLYLNPGFTLKQFAQITKVPEHQLSYLLNQHLETNFNNLINQFRIAHACKLLKDTKQQQFTIASIAYASGFHSLSVFNHHFKHMKGITPSQFRKINQSASTTGLSG